MTAGPALQGLDQHIDAAARGRLSREKLRSLSLEAASERLTVEEQLIEGERRAKEQASLAARRKGQELVLAKLIDSWGDMEFNSRRQALDVVDHVGEGRRIKVILRPTVPPASGRRCLRRWGVAGNWDQRHRRCCVRR
jgi:hypothetical protein